VIEPFLGVWPTIHPSAFVHPAAVVIGDLRIGARASVWPTAVLRGDDGPIVIDDETSIQDGAVLHATEGSSRVHVGARVTVGHRAIVHGCTIEPRCIIGMGAVILDGAVIGDGSIVGAGALIPQGKRVLPGTVVVGNPFHRLRECTADDVALIDFSWREYVTRVAQYGGHTGASAAGSAATAPAEPEAPPAPLRPR